LKILFVSSGNFDHSEVSPFVKVQAASLEDLGHCVDFNPIKGRGFQGYVKSIAPLRGKIKQNAYDLVHAHYSLSGFVAWLATLGLKKPSPKIIISLLGSDVNSKALRRFYIRSLSFIWKAVIVKSDEMKVKLGLKRALVIPNGVDLNIFKPLDKQVCRQELGLESQTKYLLFAADPVREVKNYPLALEAFNLFQTTNSQLLTANCQLLTLGNVPHSDIPKYLNACDALLLTSKWEGSPNIVKEAMACSVPVVSTQVGDVKWLFGDVEGYFLTQHEPTDVAQKIKAVFDFSGKTKGRERLIELGLDSESVARRISNVYETLL
jgi:glycosyltransferase involved in cell wall biosynthesis